jgi:hypothetical protein
MSRLDDFTKLKDGWCLGEGKCPNSLAINNAKAVLLLLTHIQDKTYTYPMPEGGIQFEFKDGPLENVEVRCYNTGEIEIENFDEEE